LLFTHKGVSGPTALGISRDIAERMAEPVDANSAPVVEVDLAPARSYEALQEDFRHEIRRHPRKTAGGLVTPFVPARLVTPLLQAAGVEETTRGAHLPAKRLNKLVSTLKGWPLGPVRHVPLERGEVVAGGVSLDEVDSQTMRSRRVPGLSLCGEVLDIAGPVGGYNLQAAWSTGYVAGESAAAP
jgi:predicted Rossmann fold flavoprotein